MNVPSWVPVRGGGLGVALLGFAITRLFVAEAIRIQGAAAYVVAALLPLVVGLGFTVFGVALAVGAFSPRYVRAVARWTFLGVVGVVVVLATTALGTELGSGTGVVVAEAPLLVANVLLGGAVAGAVIGDRSATNRGQRREIRRQANRAVFVVRLLRHEVLNAASIVRGHAGLLLEENQSRQHSVDAIQDATDRIESTVADVGLLAERDTESGLRRVASGPVLREAVAAVTDAHPRAEITVSDLPADDEVWADERLSIVFEELLTNATEHGDSGRVEVTASANSRGVRFTVTDDGPGLDDAERRLLERGEFPEYDDPASGFGLQLVQLLVDRYGGTVAVDDDGDRTSVSVTIPRERTDIGVSAGIGVSFPNLYRAVVAGLVAGSAMGLVFATTTGLLPVIGALYGVENPVVGWVTHLFHSVVFALLFAAGCSRFPRVGSRPASLVVAGVGWGAVLWLVAAGVVMPLWLRLLGTPAPVPNLMPLGFVGHAVWGLVLGATFSVLSEE